MATGVLPIALGAATRLLQYLPTRKAYQATIRLGISTTTDDITGAEISTCSITDLRLDQVTSALKNFQGQIQQLPPNYSAVQVQGQRLYDLARQGKAITVQPRTVEIEQIKILGWRPGAFPELDLEIACGPGTYIRAIARDLGTLLETGGTLASLTRTLSCGLGLEESLSFEELNAQIQEGKFSPLTAAQALQHLPLLMLPSDIAWRWACGQKIEMAVLEETLIEIATQHPILQIQDLQGHFLGITEQINGLLIPKVVLPPSTEY